MSRLREVPKVAHSLPPTNRAYIRAQVVPSEIRGIATLPESGDHVPFLVWDVSPTGLGLWMTQKVEIGAAVKVVVGQPYLLVLIGTVVWCDDVAEANGYRCGLQIDGKKDSLTALYENFGG